MKAFLDGLLPRIFPNLIFLCIPHEGKNDLQKSIPRKLRAWREPGVRFVIVQDNDSRDCKTLKRKLIKLCREGDRNDSLVRIACQELEAWYFGEPEALANAYQKPRLINELGQSRFQNSDEINQPSQQLREIIPEFQKKSGARLMSGLLSRENNTSHSFQIFLAGIQRIYDSFES
jgi:hypothetical protein